MVLDCGYSGARYVNSVFNEAGHHKKVCLPRTDWRASHRWNRTFGEALGGHRQDGWGALTNCMNRFS